MGSPTRINPSFFEVKEICAACKDLLRKFDEGVEGSYYSHHDSYESLAEAAVQKCFPCSLVLATTKKKYKDMASLTWHANLKTEADILPPMEEEQYHLLHIVSVTDQDQRTGVWFYLDPYGNNIENIISETKIDWLGDDTSSSSTMVLARQWHAACVENHGRCKLPLHKRESWQPTRLVNFDYDGEDKWRIWESSKSDGPIEYMTLSYRWNLQTHFKLVKENYSQFVQGLPLSDLPKTFQDAVTIARQFSIKYLWIDALCIIQECTEDWDREAPTMRYVYSNSFCNIAASAASDQYAGLFSPRHKDENFLGTVKSTSRQCEARNQNLLVFDENYWIRQLSCGSLHSRGWVFQECLLAPRVLYFTENQILWECFEENRSEGFPEGIPYHVRDKDLSLLWELLDKQEETKGIEPPTEMTYRLCSFWGTLIERYTLCDLTFNTDRLPAISGIAQLFAAVTRDEYLAGIWRSRLVEQLPWYTDEPDEPLSDTSVPSWSWASIRGKVKQTGLSAFSGELATLVDFKQYNQSDSANGKVLGMSLRLRGGLSVFGAQNPKAHTLNVQALAELYTSLRPDSLDIDFDMTSHELYFLPILWMNPYYPPEDYKTYFVGLILVPFSKGNLIGYRRAGRFKTESLEDIKKFGYEVLKSGKVELSESTRESEVEIF